MLQVKKTLHVQGWCPLTRFVLPTSESLVQSIISLNQEWSGGLHSHRVKAGLHLFLLWVFITCTSRTGQEVHCFSLCFCLRIVYHVSIKNTSSFAKKLIKTKKQKTPTNVKAFLSSITCFRRRNQLRRKAHLRRSLQCGRILHHRQW